VARPVDAVERYCDQLSDEIAPPATSKGGHFSCLLNNLVGMYYDEPCYTRHACYCPRYQEMRERSTLNGPDER